MKISENAKIKADPNERRKKNWNIFTNFVLYDEINCFFLLGFCSQSWHNKRRRHFDTNLWNGCDLHTQRITFVGTMPKINILICFYFGYLDFMRTKQIFWFTEQFEKINLLRMLKITRPQNRFLSMHAQNWLWSAKCSYFKATMMSAKRTYPDICKWFSWIIFCCGCFSDSTRTQFVQVNGWQIHISFLPTYHVKVNWNTHTHTHKRTFYQKAEVT